MAITLTPNNVGMSPQTQTPTFNSLGLAASFQTGPITMATILDNLFRKIGMDPSQYDFSAATDAVDGFVVNQRTHLRDVLDVLMRVYAFDLVEVDGKIKAQKRGGAVVATLGNNDLGAAVGTSPNPVTRVHTIRKQDVELPAHADLQYFSVNAMYEQATQSANRETVVDIQERLMINSTLVMTDSLARQSLNRILYTMWLEKTTYQMSLMPWWLYLAPGDVLNVTVAGNTVRMRIVSQDINLFGPVPVECVEDQTALLTQTQTGLGGPVHIPSNTFSKDTTLIAWSSNALIDADASSIGFYCAANGTEGTVWTGAVLYMSLDNGATYQEVIGLTDPSSFGNTSTALPAPARSNFVAGMLDTVNTVSVDLTAGQAPQSCSWNEILMGVNYAIVGGEVIQYQTVTNNGNNNYTLSNLIRGHRGTEVNWSGHGAGENVVFLNTGGAAPYRVPVDQHLYGKTVLLKAVTFGQAITAAVPVSLTISGAEATCYAPCSLKGTRDGSQNLTITWVRRTRTGGEWTDFVDADLGETTESYSVDIMNGLSVVRTFSASSPTVTYTAAQQTTDFGSTQSSVTVNVYQIGKYGRGYACKGTI